MQSITSKSVVLSYIFWDKQFQVKAEPQVFIFIPFFSERRRPAPSQQFDIQEESSPSRYSSSFVWFIAIRLEGQRPRSYGTFYPQYSHQRTNRQFWTIQKNCLSNSFLKVNSYFYFYSIILSSHSE